MWIFLITYHRVIVCVVVVYLHVCEKWFHVLVKEALYDGVVEVGINEHGTDVCFNYVR